MNAFVYISARELDVKDRRGRLEDKVVLITGGSEGIGAATARLFASEGARVVLSGRRLGPGQALVDRILKEGGDASFVQGDVAEEHDVRRMIEAALDRHGRLDCAVNNAGVEGQLGSILELEAAAWDRVMRVNLRGAFLCLKYQARAMRARGGGRSSTSGL